MVIENSIGQATFACLSASKHTVTGEAAALAYRSLRNSAGRGLGEKTVFVHTSPHDPAFAASGEPMGLASTLMPSSVRPALGLLVRLSSESLRGPVGWLAGNSWAGEGSLGSWLLTCSSGVLDPKLSALLSARG